MYICPLCNREFDTLIYLKKHFKSHNISYCPYCRRRYKSPLGHFAKKSDEQHLVIYYLSTNLYRNHKPYTKLFKEASEIAKKLVRK
uniref:C2H2-type domain-containing protein n=1 Tax=Saccharolobus islandicus TaxID=43080 RepID=Q5W2M4_SACIS|nr:hypothetical protein [Sulfolobus islandicus]